MDKKEEVKEVKEEEIDDGEMVADAENDSEPVSREAKITDGNKPEVYINLDGGSEKEELAVVLVPEDAYNGTIISVVLQKMKIWTKDGKDVGKEDKFLISVLLDGQKDKEGNEVLVPFFVKPTITKAYGKGVSNSKLYDILEAADLLGEVGQMSGELELLEALRAFLEARLQGKTVRVEVKTTNKNNPDKRQYSVVKTILRFVKEGN